MRSAGSGGGILSFQSYTINVNSSMSNLILQLTFIMTGRCGSPLQGRFPVHISRTTHPVLHMSTLTSYPCFLLSNVSGAIQKTVPFIPVKARPRLIVSTFLDIPKSDILQIPPGSRRMLSAFKSCK